MLEKFDIEIHHHEQSLAYSIWVSGISSRIEFCILESSAIVFP
jgi:hypothetical protein